MQNYPRVEPTIRLAGGIIILEWENGLECISINIRVFMRKIRLLGVASLLLAPFLLIQSQWCGVLNFFIITKSIQLCMHTPETELTTKSNPTLYACILRVKFHKKNMVLSHGSKTKPQASALQKGFLYF
jgi:hypothetical protein